MSGKSEASLTCSGVEAAFFVHENLSIDVFLHLFLPFELLASNFHLLPAEFSAMKRDHTSVLVMGMTLSPEGPWQRQHGLR